MIRFELGARAALAAMLLTIGAGTLTAGVFDILKGTGKKTSQNIQVRAQEPTPSPPAPLGSDTDPGYAQPVLPSPTEGAGESAMPPATGVPSAGDYAPQYSGFSDGYCGHACVGCRPPSSCGDHMHRSLALSSRRMSGKSYYCDCYPLFGPRYGFYTTCWRRLPEDCRCPILLPPRKPTTFSEPPGEESAPPSGEVVPPPPQALNLLP